MEKSGISIWKKSLSDTIQQNKQAYSCGSPNHGFTFVARRAGH
jgi:hypothetical protein